MLYGYQTWSGELLMQATNDDDFVEVKGQQRSNIVAGPSFSGLFGDFGLDFMVQEH